MMKNGYTLIELLVVMAIIGILFSVGYLSFQGYSRRQVISSVARSIQSDLRTAQEDANAGNLPVGCSGLSGYQFVVTSTSQYVINISASCSPSPNPIKSVTLPSGINISATSNSLLFKPLGQGTNITGTVTVTITQSGTNNTGTVTIGANGNIQ